MLKGHAAKYQGIIINSLKRVLATGSYHITKNKRSRRLISADILENTATTDNYNLKKFTEVTSALFARPASISSFQTLIPKCEEGLHSFTSICRSDLIDSKGKTTGGLPWEAFSKYINVLAASIMEETKIYYANYFLMCSSKTSSVLITD